MCFLFRRIVLLRIEPGTPISLVEENTEIIPRKDYCKPLVCLLRRDLEHTYADVGNTTSNQHTFNNLGIIFMSQPISCLTSSKN